MEDRITNIKFDNLPVYLKIVFLLLFFYRNNRREINIYLLCFKFIRYSFVNPFASEAVYTRNFFFDRLSDSV